MNSIAINRVFYRDFHVFWRCFDGEVRVVCISNYLMSNEQVAGLEMAGGCPVMELSPPSISDLGQRDHTTIPSQPITSQLSCSQCQDDEILFGFT